MKIALYPLRTFVLILIGLLAAHNASAVTNTWSGAGGNDNWSSAGNWSGGIPAPDNDTVFSDTDATGTANDPTLITLGTPNNIVDTSVTIGSLWYNNINLTTNSALNHTTQIPLGSTLSIVGGFTPASANANANVLTSLLVGSGKDDGLNAQNYTTINGSGVLLVSNETSIISVRQGSADQGARMATLDLAGLDTFIAHVNQIRLGADTGGTSDPALNREQGTLILARTNLIYCSSAVETPGIWIAHGSGNAGNDYLVLGQTNAIFSDAGITVGGRKSEKFTKMYFNPAFTNSNPVAYFRDRAGTGRQSLWMLGDQSANTGSSASSACGTIDFTGGTVDALVDTITIGRGAGGSSTGFGRGNLFLSAGTINANTVNVGIKFSDSAPAYGTNIVSGSGKLVVNTVMRLPADDLSSGNLTIDGGTVYANSITNGSTVASGDNINGVSVINITNGGTLVLTNSAGTADKPIVILKLGNARLGLSAVTYMTNIFASYLYTSGAADRVDIINKPVIFGYPAQFPLISYFQLSGPFDFVLNSFPATSPPLQGYLSNNVANSTIDLVITGGPTPLQRLAWKGNLSTNWDTTTKNWVNPGLVSTNFAQGDYVTFDDTSTLSTVNLTTNLSPGNVTNISTKSYTFSGPGAITGSVGLTKAGAGILTLANSGTNTFTGGVSILGGTIKLSGSADRLPTNAAVTLANVSGVYLNMNSVSQTLATLSGGGGSGSGNLILGSGTLTITGDGGSFQGIISGAGSVIKTGDSTSVQTFGGPNGYTGGTRIISGTLTVTNTTGSGTGTGFVTVESTNAVLRIGAGVLGGSVAAPTITNNGTVVINRSDDVSFATLLSGSGLFAKEGTNIVSISVVNTYTNNCIIRGGGLRISNPSALGTTNGYTQIQNDATARLELTNGITVLEPLLVNSKPGASGGAPSVKNIGGSNTLAGRIDLIANGASGWMFDATADYLRISGTTTATNSGQSTTRPLWLRGDGVGEWSSTIPNNIFTNISLRKDGAGTWILSGANTYTGPTIVSNGSLIVNGSIAAAGSVFVSWTNDPASTNFTIQGGTLGGSGTISAPVTIFPGGTLAPGNSTNSIGTLTVNNSLALSAGSTTLMEVSHTAWDQVVGITSLTLGGTLQVVVKGTLAGNEVFQLFSASGIGGGFSTTTLPPLTPPLAWNTSRLTTEGILMVTGGAPPPAPTITNQPQSVSVSVGDTAQFSVTAGPAPLSYQWRLNTANLSNGGRISGATGSVLTITNVQAADAGQYTVVVSNSGGAVTSAPPAVLTVASTTPPTLGFSQSGNGLTFSWTGAGYRLQSQTNTINVGISTNWTDYPGGGSSPVGVPISPANPTVFFRLIK